MEKDELDKIVKALGNFLWLGNNLGNFYLPEFKDMFVDAVRDAREAYDIAFKAWKELA